VHPRPHLASTSTKNLTAKYYTGERWTSQLIAFFWTQSHILWKDRFHPHTPVATATRTSLPLALDRQHNYAWKWHTYTVLICWLIGVFSIPYWRNDYNHEPLISLLRSSQLFQVSIKASTVLGRNCIPVIKTSVFISPTR
jgi:hypothetical protein